MLGRIVLAIVVGIVVGLACVLVGGLLVSIATFGWVDTLGSFLQRYAGLFGLLSALWYFFAGHALPRG
jgi:hypothetical protein